MKKSSGYGSALSLARAISVSARAGNQPRALHLPDGGDVVGDLLLGRAQLPAAG
ncbi:hypothetical protein [Klebsiella pneumoniae]|uniref:hypothetical protein n=1 Tax=Klebsiella pneumoniae TaxID=573 RepID=UPI003879AD2D